MSIRASPVGYEDSHNCIENNLRSMELENIHIFEQKKVRTMWDEEKQEWFFSIVDVCAIHTE